MRYVISTLDEQGLIGIQLSKWQKEGKLDLIEKSETLIEIEANLQRVASALETLKKVGYNSEVMRIYLQKKTGMGGAAIDNVLYAQKEFLKQIGALK